MNFFGAQGGVYDSVSIEQESPAKNFFKVGKYGICSSISTSFKNGIFANDDTTSKLGRPSRFKLTINNKV